MKLPVSVAKGIDTFTVLGTAKSSVNCEESTQEINLSAELGRPFIISTALAIVLTGFSGFRPEAVSSPTLET